MFTGLIQFVGEVKEIVFTESVLRVFIDLGGLGKNVVVGDSVACNGTCLTVTGVENGVASFDVVKESLCKTNFSSLKIKDSVNLELAMLPTDRLGGHFVSGHVDYVSRLVSIEDNRYLFELPSDFRRYFAVKGSVTVNGVSLTVTDVNFETFAVDLIPLTLKETNLGVLVPGDTVNVEIDLIARYLDRLINRT